LRFFTSKSEEEPKSLDDYVENMGENQKAIYYLATDSLKSAKTAPFLEKLVQKGIEVCILCEFCSGHNKLIMYKGNLGCEVVGQIVREVFFFPQKLN
jgi:HSP90 family molecular chaperone